MTGNESELLFEMLGSGTDGFESGIGGLTRPTPANNPNDGSVPGDTKSRANHSFAPALEWLGLVGQMEPSETSAKKI